MQSQDPAPNGHQKNVDADSEASETFYANDDKTVNSPIRSFNFDAGELAQLSSWEESKTVKKVLNNLAAVQNWSQVPLSDENWTNILAGLKKLAQQDQDFA